MYLVKVVHSDSTMSLASFDILSSTSVLTENGEQVQEIELEITPGACDNYICKIVISADTINNTDIDEVEIFIPWPYYLYRDVTFLGSTPSWTRQIHTHVFTVDDYDESLIRDSADEFLNKLTDPLMFMAHNLSSSANDYDTQSDTFEILVDTANTHTQSKISNINQSFGDSITKLQQSSDSLSQEIRRRRQILQTDNAITNNSRLHPDEDVNKDDSDNIKHLLEDDTNIESKSGARKSLLGLESLDIDVDSFDDRLITAQNLQDIDRICCEFALEHEKIINTSNSLKGQDPATVIVETKAVSSETFFNCLTQAVLQVTTKCQGLAFCSSNEIDSIEYDVAISLQSVYQTELLFLKNYFARVTEYFEQEQDFVEAFASVVLDLQQTRNITNQAMDTLQDNLDDYENIVQMLSDAVTNSSSIVETILGNHKNILKNNRNSVEILFEQIETFVQAGNASAVLLNALINALETCVIRNDLYSLNLFQKAMSMSSILDNIIKLIRFLYDRLESKNALINTIFVASADALKSGWLPLFSHPGKPPRQWFDSAGNFKQRYVPSGGWTFVQIHRSLPTTQQHLGLELIKYNYRMYCDIFKIAFNDMTLSTIAQYPQLFGPDNCTKSTCLCYIQKRVWRHVNPQTAVLDFASFSLLQNAELFLSQTINFRQWKSEPVNNNRTWRLSLLPLNLNSSVIGDEVPEWLQAAAAAVLVDNTSESYSTSLWSMGNQYEGLVPASNLNSSLWIEIDSENSSATTDQTIDLTSISTIISDFADSNCKVNNDTANWLFDAICPLYQLNNSNITTRLYRTLVRYGSPIWNKNNGSSSIFLEAIVKDLLVGVTNLCTSGYNQTLLEINSLNQTHLEQMIVNAWNLPQSYFPGENVGWQGSVRLLGEHQVHQFITQKFAATLFTRPSKRDLQVSETLKNANAGGTILNNAEAPVPNVSVVEIPNGLDPCDVRISNFGGWILLDGLTLLVHRSVLAENLTIKDSLFTKSLNTAQDQNWVSMTSLGRILWMYVKSGTGALQQMSKQIIILSQGQFPSPVSLRDGKTRFANKTTTEDVGNGQTILLQNLESFNTNVEETVGGGNEEESIVSASIVTQTYTSATMVVASPDSTPIYGLSGKMRVATPYVNTNDAHIAAIVGPSNFVDGVNADILPYSFKVAGYWQCLDRPCPWRVTRQSPRNGRVYEWRSLGSKSHTATNEDIVKQELDPDIFFNNTYAGAEPQEGLFPYVYDIPQESFSLRSSFQARRHSATYLWRKPKTTTSLPPNNVPIFTETNISNNRSDPYLTQSLQFFPDQYGVFLRETTPSLLRFQQDSLGNFDPRYATTCIGTFQTPLKNHNLHALKNISSRVSHLERECKNRKTALPGGFCSILSRYWVSYRRNKYEYDIHTSTNNSWSRLHEDSASLRNSEIRFYPKSWTMRFVLRFKQALSTTLANSVFASKHKYCPDRIDIMAAAEESASFLQITTFKDLSAASGVFLNIDVTEPNNHTFHALTSIALIDIQPLRSMSIVIPGGSGQRIKVYIKEPYTECANFQYSGTDRLPDFDQSQSNVANIATVTKSKAGPAVRRLGEFISNELNNPTDYKRLELHIQSIVNSDVFRLVNNQQFPEYNPQFWSELLETTQQKKADFIQAMNLSEDLLNQYIQKLNDSRNTFLQKQNDSIRQRTEARQLYSQARALLDNTQHIFDLAALVTNSTQTVQAHLTQLKWLLQFYQSTPPNLNLTEFMLFQRYFKTLKKCPTQVDLSHQQPKCKWYVLFLCGQNYGWGVLLRTLILWLIVITIISLVFKYPCTKKSREITQWYNEHT